MREVIAYGSKQYEKHVNIMVSNNLKNDIAAQVLEDSASLWHFFPRNISTSLPLQYYSIRIIFLKKQNCVIVEPPLLVSNPI